MRGECGSQKRHAVPNAVGASFHFELFTRTPVRQCQRDLKSKMAYLRATDHSIFSFFSPSALQYRQQLSLNSHGLDFPAALVGTGTPGVR